MKIAYALIMTTLIALPAVKGQVRQRSEVAEKDKWDLTHIYASDAQWTADKDALKQRLSKVSNYKGKLTKSAADLAGAMEFMSDLRKDLTRLYAYAGMHSDQDTRVAVYTGMKLELSQISAELGSLSAYMEPELLAADPALIQKYIAAEKRLAPFSMYLNDLMRKRKHRGSEEVEKVIAHASLMSGTASNIYSIFSNADFPHAMLDIDGKPVKLNPANFSLYRASGDRTLRKQVFETYFSKLHEFQRTFAAQLYGNLNRDLFYARARNYNTTLESALDGGNIPTAVYENLVKNVNANLNTFHRYLSLRKRMLGVDELHYYDLYAPLVGDVELSYDVPSASRHILESLKPLGQEYVDVVEYAFENRWIDMYPNEGKRSGAYSNGSAYDVHPYILMNYNGKYDDVSTLTHELGHTMHSYLTNKKQHFANSNYSIFVAEVASTVNEALLNDYYLKKIDDDEVRLSILGNYLEGAKGTLFRQTQFAEFELLIHQLVEKGEALTGEKFDQLYLELTKKYYGHDKGVCVVDDYIKSEWSYIPHFYYNYYVYQYATSFTASQAIAEKLLNQAPGALDRYLTFLSAGSTKYPVDLLVDAGVDMNSAEPFTLTMAKINAVIDEMEQILTRLGR
jgi:oligoendopeptidase F